MSWEPPRPHLKYFSEISSFNSQRYYNSLCLPYRGEKNEAEGAWVTHSNLKQEKDVLMVNNFMIINPFVWIK